MAALSTIALVSAAAVSAGYGVYSGERANSAAGAARRRQRTAQDEALRLQSIERARQVQADQAAAARPTPASTMADIDNVLASDLTGGTARDRNRIGRRSTLGGL